MSFLDRSHWSLFWSQRSLLRWNRLNCWHWNFRYYLMWCSCNAQFCYDWLLTTVNNRELAIFWNFQIQIRHYYVLQEESISSSSAAGSLFFRSDCRKHLSLLRSSRSLNVQLATLDCHLLFLSICTLHLANFWIRLLRLSQVYRFHQSWVRSSRVHLTFRSTYFSMYRQSLLWWTSSWVSCCSLVHRSCSCLSWESWCSEWITFTVIRYCSICPYC